MLALRQNQPPLKEAQSQATLRSLLRENRSEELQGGANINDSPIQMEADFDVASAYQTSCFACHATGAAGAPL